MVTSKEREQLNELNGTATPLSRDSYNTSSGSTWKRNPTPIKVGQKAPELHMVHQSGKNPFGGNPNRRAVGNPTSMQTLGRSNDLRPRKKVKTQHTPHANSSGPHTRQGDWDNTRSNSDHEISIEDDDCVLMHNDNNHTSMRISSPDELNIRSPSTEEANHPSPYQFDAPNHGSTVRNNNPSIVPDGEHTEWAKKTYPQGSSNHSMGSPAPSGHVRVEIAKIEAKTHMGDQPTKVINFREQPMKAKHKMRTKDNFFSRQPPSRAQPSRAQSSRAPAKKEKTLPLKGLYLDDAGYCENLEISWLIDKITIKSDRVTIFGPLDIRSNADSLTYCPDLSPDYDPVFQLKTIPGGRSKNPVRCVTVKLDCSNPSTRENYYTDLLEWLKDRVNNKAVIRSPAEKSLWDSVDSLVQDRGSEFLQSQGNPGKDRLDKLRQGEPQRAMRSLGDDRSKPTSLRKRSVSQTSLRYTPDTPVPVMVSDDPKPNKQRSRHTSDLLVGPRRSTRNMSGTARSPAVDNDEVILVYPPGVPGAVNITNGDFLRLQPEEFLNDTLIEFGLKLWLKELEQTKPELASQIHVFNSFFYKKLNHQKKGINLGYESVRKWTSKFDIFQKKYIIVPINEHLHWYFAIICDPEYVLVPTAPNASPSTRQKTRQSISDSMITDEPNETPISSKSVSTTVSENGKDEEKLGTPSEAEVEDTLHDFQGSCSISNIEPDENVADLEGGRSPSALSYVSDDRVLRPLSPTASDHERATLRHSPSDENMAMGDDLPPILQSTSHDDPVPESHSVGAAHFYRPASPKRDKGKRKADPQPESFVMEINDDDDDDNGGSVSSDTPKTYIFTFDSLGGRHPQAINKLSAYLKMEAKDKKQIENAGNAEGKQAMVPSQPNFCDCGIYLLHLAQLFMSNPAHYRRIILMEKSKTVPHEERRIIWNDHQVIDKRQELRARIMKLSSEWKKERAAKEKDKDEEASNSQDVEVVESSDGEINILESTPSSSKAKPGGKKKTRQMASRLRG